MKKITVLCVCALMMFGCSSAKKGTAEVKNDKGDVTTAEVTVKDGKIEKVSIDEKQNGSDKSKKELKDGYNMKGASSIKKEWYEQILFLENYIKENGYEGIKMDAEGKATNEDVKTGCTVKVSNYIEAVKQAEANAK